MTDITKKNEQNTSQYKSDKASALLIESGSEEIQRALGIFRCVLRILKAELSLPIPQNLIVSYVKDEDHNCEQDRVVLAQNLLKIIEDRLVSNSKEQSNFINEFCKYRLSNMTLGKMIAEFKNAYKNELLDITQEEFLEINEKIQTSLKKIETGQDELLQRHRALVASLVNSKGRMLTTTDRQDLLQEGYLGLINSTDRYNFRLETCFMTFAYYQVRQNIDSIISSQFKTFKVPVNVFSKIATIAATSQKMTKRLGREPTLSELASEMNMEKGEINDIKLISSSNTAVYDISKNDDYIALAESIPDPSQKDILEIISEEQCKEIISSIVNSMKDNNRAILSMRYGLNGDAPLSRDQIGMILGLSGERVRQIENSTLKQLARNSALQELICDLIEQQKNK